MCPHTLNEEYFYTFVERPQTLQINKIAFHGNVFLVPTDHKSFKVCFLSTHVPTNI